MLASKGLGEHLVRGVVGIGALVAAPMVAALHPWLALALIPAAFVALRGCPMCWTMGLVETWIARGSGDGGMGACTDGRCARRQRPR